MVKAQRILVTGANGFIGRKLCLQLQADGYFVIAVLRKHLPGPWDQVRIADFSSQINDNIAQDVDTIFHLASVVHARGTDQALYQSVIVKGTEQLLLAGQRGGVSRFIYFSSIKVMGESTDGCIDEMEVAKPLTPYGQAKWQAEQLVLADDSYQQRIALRLSPVYGDGMCGSLLRMQNAISKGVFPRLPVLDNHRSFVHVDDVAAACITVLASLKPIAKSYFLSDTQPLSISDIEHLMRSENPTRGLYVPLFVWKQMAWTGNVLGTVLGRSMPFDQLQYDAMFADACYRSHLFEADFSFQFSHSLADYLAEKTGE